MTLCQSQSHWSVLELVFTFVQCCLSHEGRYMVVECIFGKGAHFSEWYPIMTFSFWIFLEWFRKYSNFTLQLVFPFSFQGMPLQEILACQWPIDHSSPYPAVHAPIFPMSTSLWHSSVHKLAISYCSICQSDPLSSCSYPAEPHCVYMYGCQLIV